VRRDLDGDGYLTEEEWVKACVELGKHGLAAKALAAMDANHDGKVDEKEYNRRTELFFRWDKNGDGRLDGTEHLGFSRTPEEMAAQRREFAQRDLDKSGRLSLEEFTAASKTSK
jgi:Ca2+-binding EF-hand superfamily protein